MAWMSNYINNFFVDVITYPCISICFTQSLLATAHVKGELSPLIWTVFSLPVWLHGMDIWQYLLLKSFRKYYDNVKTHTGETNGMASKFGETAD